MKWLYYSLAARRSSTVTGSHSECLVMGHPIIDCWPTYLAHVNICVITIALQPNDTLGSLKPLTMAMNTSTVWIGFLILFLTEIHFNEWPRYSHSQIPKNRFQILESNLPSRTILDWLLVVVQVLTWLLMFSLSSKASSKYYFYLNWPILILMSSSSQSDYSQGHKWIHLHLCLSCLYWNNPTGKMHQMTPIKNFLDHTRIYTLHHT